MVLSGRPGLGLRCAGTLDLIGLNDIGHPKLASLPPTPHTLRLLSHSTECACRVGGYVGGAPTRIAPLKPRPSPWSVVVPSLHSFGVCAPPPHSPVGKRALECERQADQLPVIRAEQHDAHGHATARKLDGRGQHDGGRAADSA